MTKLQNNKIRKAFNNFKHNRFSEDFLRSFDVYETPIAIVIADIVVKINEVIDKLNRK